MTGTAPTYTEMESASEPADNDFELQCLTIKRLIEGGAAERADRKATDSLLNEALAGRKEAILEMPLHSCALFKYRYHDLDKLKFIDDQKYEDPEIFSRLASMYLQVKDYKKTGELFRDLALRRPLTALEDFLAFKAAFMRKDNRYLQAFEPESLMGLANRFPNIAYELLARHQLYEDSAAYQAEVDLYAKVDYAESFNEWTQRFRSLRLEETGRDRSDEGRAQNFRSDILAVYGMRCSGGSAIQDFLSDFSDIKSSAGEYLLMSGSYGLRYIKKHAYSGFAFHEMLRHHLFGTVVPVNRSFSRLLRQAAEDRQFGLLPNHVDVVEHALGGSEDRATCLQSILDGIWQNYVSRHKKKIMLKKLFSSGNFDELHKLPPFLGVMVWRDPRDQYVDQIQRGFVRKGDVVTFVSEFRAKVQKLKSGLEAASKKHRDEFVSVGFEEFVYSDDYRARLVSRIGIHAGSCADRRFDPAASSRNVGIWQGKVSDQEVAYIEKELYDFMNSSCVPRLT